MTWRTGLWLKKPSSIPRPSTFQTGEGRAACWNELTSRAERLAAVRAAAVWIVELNGFQIQFETIQGGGGEWDENKPIVGGSRLIGAKNGARVGLRDRFSRDWGGAAGDLNSNCFEEQ